MKTWLAALPQWLQQGRDCVLVTVVQVQGSTPREAGASMLVRLPVHDPATHDGPFAHDSQLDTQIDTQIDTIGGGHLEWQACDIARQMLLAPDAEPVRLERFNLGARLGQCCGGLALVALEKISANDAETWQQRIHSLTAVPSAGDAPYLLQRQLTAGDTASVWTLVAHYSGQAETAAFEQPDRQTRQGWIFRQSLLNHQFHVLVFGAGHVGHALVQALLPLEASICWVDVRDQVFPPLQHPNLRCISTDTPEYEIAHAPANSYFLIMTHNHALDLALCQALFKRNDYAYFGLIGSRSKRAVFEKRLRERGVVPAQLEQMICPIGVQGISSKEPAAIAVSVAAQLLQVKSLYDRPFSNELKVTKQGSRHDTNRNKA